MRSTAEQYADFTVRWNDHTLSTKLMMIAKVGYKDDFCLYALTDSTLGQRWVPFFEEVFRWWVACRGLAKAISSREKVSSEV